MKFRATLSSKERIKSRKVIQKLFNEGDSLFVHPFKLVYSIEESEDPILQLKFGVSVPASIFRKAVQRNRLKRKAREYYRVKKRKLVEQYSDKALKINLFFIYIDKTGNESKMEKSIQSLLSKISVILEKSQQ